MAIDTMPGFRRRFRIGNGAGWVRSEVEDDFHRMTVTLRHKDGVVTAVEPQMHRAPWTTCPGALTQIQQSFVGTALKEFSARQDKTQNCTHLFDLALLAAAHVADAQAMVFDILVSDPLDGVRVLEVRRNGQPLMTWTEKNHQLQTPSGVAGLRLDQLRNWIESLAPPQQEAARLLRWGGMLAHGRTIPMERQSDARRMPANCYTFQPQRAAVARRIGESRDFSRDDVVQPLQTLESKAP